DLRLRRPESDRKHCDLGGVADAGQLSQSSLCLTGQAGQLPDHQLHDIVGVALGANAIEIPGPACRVMVEAEKSLFGERRNELNREEWIAACLLVYQLRERRNALRFVAKSIRKQLPEMLAGERRQRDLLDLGAGIPDGLELSGQRMRGIDLVVPIGANHQQVLHVRLGQQVLDQVKGRRVEPLQIVEKERQRMFGPGEDADKSPKHQLEAPLRVLWRKIRGCWLFSDDELQFGNELDHELAVRAQRLAQGVVPARQLGVALAEKRSHQALKGLRQSRIRDVALVLVELARGEKTARRHQHLVQLIDDGGLADARVAQNQHHLEGAVGYHAIERREKCIDLGLSAIELFRNQQSV